MKYKYLKRVVFMLLIGLMIFSFYLIYHYKNQMDYANKQIKYANEILYSHFTTSYTWTNFMLRETIEDLDYTQLKYPLFQQERLKMYDIQRYNEVSTEYDFLTGNLENYFVVIYSVLNDNKTLQDKDIDFLKSFLSERKIFYKKLETKQLGIDSIEDLVSQYYQSCSSIEEKYNGYLLGVIEEYQKMK